MVGSGEGGGGMAVPSMRNLRSTRLGLVAGLLLLALTACGGGGGEATGGGTEGGGEETAAAEGGGGNGGEGLIWVGLPDTQSSARWEDFDRPAFEAAFSEAGLEEGTDYLIANAEGDPTTQQTQAEQALTQGATVIVLTNLDSGSGAAIHDAAKQAGAAVVDYDRLTLGGQADVYVSFDNERVGQLQGETLVSCVEEMGIESPNFAVLNGSPDDNNATLFANGYNSVLEPKEAEGWTRLADQSVPDWDNNQAQTIFEQMLTQNNNDIQAVLAANDGLANAAIVGLRGQGLNGQVPVTGQDATAQGLGNIALGDQCMTVYKPVDQEALAAAEAALALRGGEEVSGAEDTVNNEATDVPAILLEPVAVTAENLSRPVDDGFVEVSAICTGDVAQTEFCQSQQG
jgi:D-xylose transport system substrate-binding protein